MRSFSKDGQTMISSSVSSLYMDMEKMFIGGVQTKGSPLIVGVRKAPWRVVHGCNGISR